MICKPRRRCGPLHTADAEAFVKWHAGQLTWAQTTQEGRIQVDGLPSLVRAFPTWNARSMFPTSGRSLVSRRDAQADNRDPAAEIQSAIGQLLSIIAK